MKVEAPSYEEGVGVDGGWQGYALQIGARGISPGRVEPCKKKTLFDEEGNK